MDKNVEYILKDMGRTVPDGATAVMGKDHIFFLHPTRRFDPVTIGAMALMAGGTVMQMQATRQEGKDAQKIAEQRAAIDMANAEQTRKSSVVEAQIRGEKGRRFLAAQKSQIAAGNIRLNVGSPLVIEAETRQLIAQDIGYVLETGRTESDMLRSSAALEIAQGKAIKRQKKASALAQGLQGFGSMATMGKEAGLFGKTKTV